MRRQDGRCAATGLPLEDKLKEQQRSKSVTHRCSGDCPLVPALASYLLQLARSLVRHVCFFHTCLVLQRGLIHAHLHGQMDWFS